MRSDVPIHILISAVGNMNQSSCQNFGPVKLGKRRLLSLGIGVTAVAVKFSYSAG